MDIGILQIVQILRAGAEFLRVSALFLELRKKRWRRWWVRPINLNREDNGFHMGLFQEVKTTDHEEFHRMTRMWPDQFEALYALVRPRLLKRSFRKPLHPELRLVLTLTYLAHGDSMYSKRVEFRVGRSTVYKIVPEVCKVLWEVLQPSYLAPPTAEEWSQIAGDMMAKWQFPNCVGAIDGRHIRIQCPPNSGTLFSNYKKFYSLVLMATCDANLKFTWVDIGQYGSISDGGVWSHTDFAQCLEDGTIPFPPKAVLPGTALETNFAFVADEAFPLKKHILRPYPRAELNDPERVFNYRLSRARRTIENSFGVLVSRWRILTRPLCCSVHNSVLIVKALVCLHNFVMAGENNLAAGNRRYCPPTLIDSEADDGALMEGAWRGDEEQSNIMTNVRRLSSNNTSVASRAQREVLKEYFLTETGEQQVPFQYERALHNINPPVFV